MSPEQVLVQTIPWHMMPMVSLRVGSTRHLRCNHQRFPGWRYSGGDRSAVSFCLTCRSVFGDWLPPSHGEEVEQYLAQRGQKAVEMRETNEQKSSHLKGIRARLLARR